MTGQIPKYGAHFRLGSAEWHPTLGMSLYILKKDAQWYIRSDKTSKRWYVFHNNTHMGRVQPSLREAMSLLLDGIDQGFYEISEDVVVHAADCGLQGSGLDKSCTCRGRAVAES
jgi:hypothetical protein